MTSTEGVHSVANAVPSEHRPLPGQVVLVMQGGGAPGCYQAGVYQAMHEAGIERDWVVGASRPLCGTRKSAEAPSNDRGQRQTVVQHRRLQLVAWTNGRPHRAADPANLRHSGH